MNQQATTVSIIIPTRDRPNDLARCLPTVLANDYADFEVIVVDQSSTDATERLVATHQLQLGTEGSVRLRYCRTHTVGAARARNEGTRLARGEILGFTDDDCTAPSDWIARAVGVFTTEPRAAVLFGAFVAAPHDPTRSFVPTFVPRRYAVLHGHLRFSYQCGVSANMFFPQSVVSQIEGPFASWLGAGSEFRSAEDIDFAYRVLRSGLTIVQDPANAIVHWGERSYASGAASRIMAGSYYGIGAFYTLHAARGDPVAGYLLVREAAALGLETVWRVVRNRRPLGVQRLRYFVLGAVKAIRWSTSGSAARG